MQKCNFMETFTGMLVFCDKINSITVISNLVCLPLKSLTKFAQARIPGLWPATLFTLKRVFGPLSFTGNNLSHIHQVINLCPHSGFQSISISFLEWLIRLKPLSQILRSHSVHFVGGSSKPQPTQNHIG